MKVIQRGIKNAFRNPVRTVAIILILGLSMGLSLSMLIARGAVQEKITSVKTSIGNTITISPAGFQGFEGGGEPLTNDQIAQIKTLDGITTTVSTLRDRLTSDSTSIVSGIDAGSLGNRAGNTSGVGFQTPPPDAPQRGQASSGEQTITRTFTPPVTVLGVDDVSKPSVYGGDSVTITEGSAIDASQDVNEAVIGKLIAEKNSLSVGSTFTIYGSEITVKGIYDAGSEFANNSAVLPLLALQRLSSQTGAVTSVIATVSSIDVIDAKVTEIETLLGDSADVVSNQESAKTVIDPLESVKTISTYSVVGTVIAAGVIILLSMMMIVRERRREIGVMKAIGSTNFKTVVQFVSESVTLTLLGLIVAFVIGIAASGTITNTLVNNANSSTTTQEVPGGLRGRPGATINAALRGVQTVTPNAGNEVILYGIAIAMGVAALGSALPAYMISKVRPSEVMRAD